LFGVVEVDEAYIGSVRDETEKGRSTAKAPVVGAVEDKGDSAGSLVLQHVDNARGETIDPWSRRVSTGRSWCARTGSRPTRALLNARGSSTR